MRGLDPRIHLVPKMMDCRVKPGNDDHDSKWPEIAIGMLNLSPSV
jgi:hypothetical protein